MEASLKRKEGIHELVNQLKLTREIDFERKKSERLLEMRNYDSVKKTNNTLGESEKSAAKQVKERYRKSLEEQIENDRRIKQLKQDMTVHEEKMNSNEVKVIKRFKLDSSVAAFLKDSPLYIPTVRQSPESKPQGMIRTFKSKLPPSFIGSKMI